MANRKPATGIRLLKWVQLFFFEACIAGKMQWKPFPALREIRSMRSLQLVRSDLCGPMPSKCVGGNRYFVTFVDVYSRYCGVYFYKRGAEVADKFKLLERCVANDTCQNINSLQNNIGGEYLSQKFGSYMESKGIPHDWLCPTHLTRTVLKSGWIELSSSQLNHW